MASTFNLRIITAWYQIQWPTVGSAEDASQAGGGNTYTNYGRILDHVVAVALRDHHTALHRGGLTTTPYPVIQAHPACWVHCPLAATRWLPPPPLQHPRPTYAHIIYHVSTSIPTVHHVPHHYSNLCSNPPTNIKYRATATNRINPAFPYPPSPPSYKHPLH